MPTPNANETEKDYMDRCIPIVMKDGTAKDNKQAVAVCASMWKEAHKAIDPTDLQVDALKVGARHSASDQAALQSIHDAVIGLGAACPQPKGEVYTFGLSDERFIEPLIAFGSAVKSLGVTPEGVHVGGHLVLFGSPDLTDKSPERDFFTKNTDFDIDPGESKDVSVYFHHRQPLKTADDDDSFVIVRKKIGRGKVRLDDVGVLIDAIIYNRTEYEKAIAENATKYMGWSSGTAPHLYERVPQPNGTNWLKSWPIGLDATVTPTPAEPRIRVMPLKSILGDLQVVETDEAEGTGEVPPTEETPAVKNTANLITINQEQLDQIVEAVATKVTQTAVEAVLEQLRQSQE